jgi:phosphopantetheinyl transferase
VFSYEELYFSTAHSEDLLVVAIDSKKVAVDVEHIQPRDESLLQNVHVPDSSYSLWENFYLQWCAKECLVKYLDLTSSEMNEMTVSAFMPNHYFSADGWEFNSLMILHYR